MHDERSSKRRSRRSEFIVFFFLHENYIRLLCANSSFDAVDSFYYRYFNAFYDVSMRDTGCTFPFLSRENVCFTFAAGYAVYQFSQHVQSVICQPDGPVHFSKFLCAKILSDANTNIEIISPLFKPTYTHSLRCIYSCCVLFCWFTDFLRNIFKFPLFLLCTHNAQSCM